MRALLHILSVATLLLLCASSAMAQTPFTPNNIIRGNSPFDGFGTSIAIDRSLMVIGSPFAGPSTYGSATVYRKSGTTWSKETELIIPSGEQTIDSCGMSVSAFNGSAMGDIDVLVIGCPSVTVKGRAYVYIKENGNWKLSERLIAPTESMIGDEFGKYTATIGRTVIVGGFNGVYGFQLKMNAGVTDNTNAQTITPLAGLQFVDSVSSSGPWVTITGKDGNFKDRLYVLRHQPPSSWTGTSQSLGEDNTGMNGVFASIMTTTANNAMIAMLKVDMTTNKRELQVLTVNDTLSISPQATTTLPSNNNILLAALISNTAEHVAVVTIEDDPNNIMGDKPKTNAQLLEYKNQTIKEIAAYKPANTETIFTTGLKVTDTSLMIGVNDMTGDAVHIKTIEAVTPPDKPVITLTSPSIAKGGTYTTSNTMLKIEGTCKTAQNVACSSVSAMSLSGVMSKITAPDNDGKFTISFTSPLTGSTEVALNGQTSSGQTADPFNFTVVYDTTATNAKTPSITSPSENLEAFEETDTIVLSFDLDPVALTDLILEFRDTDEGDLWVEKASQLMVQGQFSWPTSNIVWQPGSYRVTAITTGADETASIEFSIYEEPLLTINGQSYEPESGTRPEVPISFTIGGRDSVEGGTVFVTVKDGQELATTTVNDNGTWTLTITSPGVGDRDFSVYVVTDDGFVLEQEDDIELSIVPCSGDNCTQQPDGFKPTQVNTSLCTTASVPALPAQPGLPLLALLLIGMFWRRRDAR